MVCVEVEEEASGSASSLKGFVWFEEREQDISFVRGTITRYLELERLTVESSCRGKRKGRGKGGSAV